MPRSCYLKKKNNGFGHKIHTVLCSLHLRMTRNKKYNVLARELSFISNQSVFHFHYSLFLLWE